MQMEDVYKRQAVHLLDQRQQTKLCDKEVRDAADKRGKDLGAADFACGICSAASFSETGVDSFDPVSYTHLDVYKRQG